jgi:hypothetical protein
LEARLSQAVRQICLLLAEQALLQNLRDFGLNKELDHLDAARSGSRLVPTAPATM